MSCSGKPRYSTSRKSGFPRSQTTEKHLNLQNKKKRTGTNTCSLFLFYYSRSFRKGLILLLLVREIT